MTHKEIQNDLVERYRITLKQHSDCYCRMHAHVRTRTVCKWIPANSVKATFALMHEIGHIETTKTWMRRAEEEYFATKWALEKAREYGMDVPKKLAQTYQDYIDRELERGKRRGGTCYGDLNLFKG